MQAGKLDQRITIRSRPLVKSPTGADVPGDPVTFQRVWASIKASKRAAAEYYSAERFNIKNHYDIEIRYLSGVSETMEIYWEDRDLTLDIIEIQNLGGRPLNLKITAEERA